MDKDEKLIIANRLSSKKYYDANSEKVKQRTREYYAQKKTETKICKPCGKNIPLINYSSHLKTKKHLKNIANNSILQFMKFDENIPTK